MKLRLENGNFKVAGIAIPGPGNMAALTAELQNN